MWYANSLRSLARWISYAVIIFPLVIAAIMAFQAQAWLVFSFDVLAIIGALLNILLHLTQPIITQGTLQMEALQARLERRPERPLDS